jgi:hypothetical protein
MSAKTSPKLLVLSARIGRPHFFLLMPRDSQIPVTKSRSELLFIDPGDVALEFLTSALRYPLQCRLNGPKSRSGRCGVQQNLLFLS